MQGVSHMKKLKVYNSLDIAITVVIDFDNDHVLQPRSAITIETDATFNSDMFYVEGDQEWKAKYNTENGDIEIYIAGPQWNDEAWKMYGKRMQSK